jgi:hypothetical protein
MPAYFRLGNPGITSISVDGQEHGVNADGLLEVHEAHLTPGLVQEITGHYAGAQHHPADDDGVADMRAAEDDRAILFAQLDVIHGRRIDRRRSLPQLQEMLADHEARQARATSTDLVTTSP